MRNEYEEQIEFYVFIIRFNTLFRQIRQTLGILVRGNSSFVLSGGKTGVTLQGLSFKNHLSLYNRHKIISKQIMRK